MVPWPTTAPTVALLLKPAAVLTLMLVSSLSLNQHLTALASAPREKMPTVVLWRVFRCSNAIQDTVEYLQLACSKKDKEFGFAVDPRVQIRGHDVRGDRVEWIPCNKTEHMICAQECHECFLKMIDGALAEKLKTLETNVGIGVQVKIPVCDFSQQADFIPINQGSNVDTMHTRKHVKPHLFHLK